ncbi:hypothetical protein Ddye_008751 [Dipteronia dyeriana]|uniref:Uncharacterized protein n=1 Tax=Dipteronia dyeriana TaxID=168575 RepID=A0AAD9XA44_9ROSI|nr:hypothetical protein Ddye_008751 [Dipteronia dyeriana]
MSMSMEALAMAGVDYVEWGLHVEEWEREDSELPPPHLLAEEEEEEQQQHHHRESCDIGGVTLDCNPRISKRRSWIRVIERMWNWLICMKKIIAAVITRVVLIMRKRLIKPFVAAPLLITNCILEISLFLFLRVLVLMIIY